MRALCGALCVIFCGALCIGFAEPPVARAHGTTDAVIEESDLTDTPPADYKINPATQGDAKDKKYNDYFLKEDLQTISIQIDENNLNYLFQNAADKPTVMAESVKVGDQEFGYVGLRTKGNYTLSHTVTDYAESDRFSFALNFGKYITEEKYGEEQTFFGCDKISLNNFFFDGSMMKEYCSMKLMTEMGLPAPQYGLAKVYINDRYYGVYFMVESMERSIIKQYKNAKGSDVSKYLTKPEDTTLKYDDAMDKYLTKDGSFDLSSVLKRDADGTYTATGLLAKQGELWEYDEDTLQDVAELLPDVLSWQKKLTGLSEGKDFSGDDIDVNSEAYLELLEQIMDVDEVVRYFAASSFLVQMDNMFVEQHNFGLYIDGDGKCMIVPWDYDLSFGCYFPSTAEATANFDLDTMYKTDGTGFAIGLNNEYAAGYEDYPLFHVIFQNKKLMEKYHQYMKDCAKVAALGGEIYSGKTFPPGFFHASIAGIQEKLIEAASEKLADNVYYVNHQRQPQGVRAALPNLSKIVAMRSVGVLLQAEGEDALVTGQGCHLETLGNAMPGSVTAQGKLAAVDAATGIFTIGDYASTWSKRAPELKVSALGSGDADYKMAEEALGSGGKLAVYEISDKAKSTDGYTLYIPFESAEEAAKMSVFRCDSGGLEKREAQTEDNFVVLREEELGCFAFIDNPDASASAVSRPGALYGLWILAGAIVVIAGLCIFIKKRKSLKKS